MQSIYQLLQDSPDEQTFRAAKNGMRISDVLDLVWMVAGPLELRSVQEILERLTAAVLPGERLRFSPYNEPRYRSALQLQVGGLSARFAHGGVLVEWPGRPQGGRRSPPAHFPGAVGDGSVGSSGGVRSAAGEARHNHLARLGRPASPKLLGCVHARRELDLPATLAGISGSAAILPSL